MSDTGDKLLINLEKDLITEYNTAVNIVHEIYGLDGDGIITLTDKTNGLILAIREIGRTTATVSVDDKHVRKVSGTIFLKLLKLIGREKTYP